MFCPSSHLLLHILLESFSTLYCIALLSWQKKSKATKPKKKTTFTKEQCCLKSITPFACEELSSVFWLFGDIIDVLSSDKHHSQMSVIIVTRCCAQGWDRRVWKEQTHHFQKHFSTDISFNDPQAQARRGERTCDMRRLSRNCIIHGHL